MMVRTIKRMICGRFITVESVQLLTVPTMLREKFLTNPSPSLTTALMKSVISGGTSNTCQPNISTPKVWKPPSADHFWIKSLA